MPEVSQAYGCDKLILIPILAFQEKEEYFYQKVQGMHSLAPHSLPSAFKRFVGIAEFTSNSQRN
jgi:hypothetical protein